MCGMCVEKRRAANKDLEILCGIHVSMTDHYVADRSAGETDFGPSWFDLGVDGPSLDDRTGRTGNLLCLAIRSIDYRSS